MPIEYCRKSIPYIHQLDNRTTQTYQLKLFRAFQQAVLGHKHAPRYEEPLTGKSLWEDRLTSSTRKHQLSKVYTVSENRSLRTRSVRGTTATKISLHMAVMEVNQTSRQAHPTRECSSTSWATLIYVILPRSTAAQIKSTYPTLTRHRHCDWRRETWTQLNTKQRSKTRFLNKYSY